MIKIEQDLRSNKLCSINIVENSISGYTLSFNNGVGSVEIIMSAKNLCHLRNLLGVSDDDRQDSLPHGALKDELLQIPQTGFLRLDEVLKFIPVGKSTWWKWVKDGIAPKSIKLSERITAWKAEDIKLFIDQKYPS